MRRDQNLLFIWIPKNGGTSCYHVLQEKFAMKLIMNNYSRFNGRGHVTFGHAQIAQLLEAGFLPQDYYISALVFAIVRDPYTRFVALYHDYCHHQLCSGDMTSLACEIKQARENPHRVTTPGLYNICEFSQSACQVDWLLPGCRRLRFEDLGRQFNAMFGVEIPHLNQKTPDGRAHMDYYDKESIALVNELYARDFQTLGYPMIT